MLVACVDAAHKVLHPTQAAIHQMMAQADIQIHLTFCGIVPFHLTVALMTAESGSACFQQAVVLQG